MKRKYNLIEREAVEATGLTPSPASSSSTGQLHCNFGGTYGAPMFEIDSHGSFFSTPTTKNLRTTRDDISESDTTLLSNEATVVPVSQKFKGNIKNGQLNKSSRVDDGPVQKDRTLNKSSRVGDDPVQKERSAQNSKHGPSFIPASQNYKCHICVADDKQDLRSFPNVDSFQHHLLSTQHILVVQKNDKLFYCSVCKRLFGHDVNNWVRHLTSKAHTKKLRFAGGKI